MGARHTYKGWLPAGRDPRWASTFVGDATWGRIERIAQLIVVLDSRVPMIDHALHRVVLHTERECNQNAGFHVPQVPGMGRKPWASPVVEERKDHGPCRPVCVSLFNQPIDSLLHVLVLDRSKLIEQR